LSSANSLLALALYVKSFNDPVAKSLKNRHRVAAQAPRRPVVSERGVVNRIQPVSRKSRIFMTPFRGEARAVCRNTLVAVWFRYSPEK